MHMLHALSHKVYFSNFKPTSFAFNLQDNAFQGKSPSSTQANPASIQNHPKTTFHLKCTIDSTLEFTLDETQVMLSDAQLKRIKSQFELADLDGNG